MHARGFRRVGQEPILTGTRSPCLDLRLSALDRLPRTARNHCSDPSRCLRWFPRSWYRCYYTADAIDGLEGRNLSSHKNSGDPGSTPGSGKAGCSSMGTEPPCFFTTTLPSKVLTFWRLVRVRHCSDSIRRGNGNEQTPEAPSSTVDYCVGVPHLQRNPRWRDQPRSLC